LQGTTLETLARKWKIKDHLLESLDHLDGRHDEMPEVLPPLAR